MKLFKHISIILVFIFVISICGCSNQQDKHKHTLVYDLGYDATCTEAGLSRGSHCSDCGEVFSTQKEIPPLGHKYVETVVDATCTENGYKHVECSRCKDSTLEVIYSTGHQVEEYDEMIEATCTEDGYKKGSCILCNEIITIVIPALGHSEGEQHYTGDYCGDHKIGYVECATCEERIYEFGHSYKQTTIEATCTEDGKRVYTCIHCNETYEEIIKSHGHITDEWVIETESTCTKEGSATLSCIICEEVVDTMSIKKKDHTYESSVGVNKITYSCIDCSDTYDIDTTEYYNITFVSNGGTEYENLTVASNTSFYLPTPEKEGYEFAGWYLDEELENLYTDEFIIAADIILYAGWYLPSIKGNLNSNNIITDVKKDFTFEVTSVITLNQDNLTEYIFIEDTDGNTPSIYIKEYIDGGYVIASDEYKNGTKYSVKIIEPLSFNNAEGYELWFIVEEENYSNIKYKDGVKFLDILEIYNVYEDEENIYIFLRTDLFNVNDIVVVYEDDINNVSFAMMIVAEGVFETQIVYEITSPDPSLVFEEYDIYYSGELEISEINFNDNLEDDLIEGLTETAEYYAFEESAKRFAKQSSDPEFRYVYKGITIKPKFDTDGGAIIISLPAVAKFERINQATNEAEGEFRITFQLSFIIKFNSTLSGDIDDFTFVIDTSVTVKADIFASYVEEESEARELDYFKKILKDVKKSGAYKEIKQTLAQAKKTIKIGQLTIRIPGGFNINVDLDNILSTNVIGQAGISAKFTINTSIGVSYKAGDGITPIKSFSSSAEMSLYMMGKVESSKTINMRITLSFLGVVNVYIEAEVGPYLEFGGMISTSVSSGGGNNNISGGYAELGVKLDIRVGANAQLQIKFKLFGKKINKKFTLFEKEWELYSNKFNIISIGKKEVNLYFTDVEEDIEYDYICGDSNLINVDDLINKTIVVQKLTELSTYEKEITASYTLSGNYAGIKINSSGILEVNNFSIGQIKIKVSCGDIYKIVYLTININHKDKIHQQINPTCTQAGNTYYVSCSVCDKILEGEDKPIPALGHTEVIDERVEPTCTNTGLTEGCHCSVCGRNLIAQKTIPALGHTEVIDKKVEPTCTTNGLTQGSHCSVCNEILITQKTIPALGHKWIEGTCDHAKECSVCKEIEGEPLGHNLIIDNKIEATCTTTGLTEGCHCSRCDYKIEQVEIPMMGHEYIETIVAPTCQDEGYTRHTCSRCESSYNDTYVEKVKHTFVDGVCVNIINGQACNTLITQGEIEYSLSPDGTYAIVSSIGNATELSKIIIKELYMGKPVTIIAEDIFKDAQYLNEIVIPETIEIIEAGAFENCKYLTNIIYQGTEQYWNEIDKQSGWDTGIAKYNISYEGTAYTRNLQYTLTDNTYVVSGIGSAINEENIIIPEYYKGYPVVTINDEAFKNCANIKTIQINANIKSIGNGVFENCTLLESITIPTTISVITDNMFKQCVNLKEVNLPTTIKSIGNNAFDGCISLKSIMLPNGVISIGTYAFANCTSLETIKLPAGISVLSEGIFSSCNNLTNIYLPNTITKVDEFAFKQCTKLENVYYDGDISSWMNIQLLDSPMNYGKHFYLLNENDIYYEVTEIIIPNAISKLNQHFSSFDNITSIILPISLINIDNDAFEDCIKLENVYYNGTVESWFNIVFGNETSNPMHYATHLFINNEEVISLEIPSTVKSINDYQLYGIDELTQLIIPNNVVQIGEYAISNCSMLVNVKYLGTIAEWNVIDKDISWNENSTNINVLYAEERYSITLDSNFPISNAESSTGTESIYSKLDGTSYLSKESNSIITTVTIPTHIGYTFEGYYVGDVMYIDAQGNILSTLANVTNNMTLVARWSLTHYTLTVGNEVIDFTYFNEAGERTKYSDYNIDAYYMPKKYHIFQGWIYNGMQISDSTEICVASDHALSGMYKVVEYLITYHHVVDDTRYSVIYTCYNSDAIFKNYADCGFSVIGKNFIKWNTKSDGSGTDYYAGDAIFDSIDGNKTSINLYAIYENIRYRLNFRDYDTNEWYSTSFYIYDETTKLPIEPEKANYLFKEWYSADFKIGDKMPAHDVTLYAKWISNTVTENINNDNKTIDASYEYHLDYFDISQYSQFFNANYTFTFTIRVYMKEKYDGYQEIYLANSLNENLGGEYEHRYGGDSKKEEAGWGDYIVIVVSGDKCTSEMHMIYGGHGEGSDDWVRYYMEYTLVVS